jgi:hypothetical protein
VLLVALLREEATNQDDGGLAWLAFAMWSGLMRAGTEVWKVGSEWADNDTRHNRTISQDLDYSSLTCLEPFYPCFIE